MNLPTKWAYILLFADKLAKFADEILFHGRKHLGFETQFFRDGVSQPPQPTVATALSVGNACESR